ncbi:uncharacterized protein LOC110462319 [Mizuhopecten yessoensis]|uniref:uncharacterized protein LOC110462319 n=1 Tax=Mizuhopecten yessoensis TaxID=6573 RepID=UPI000B45EB4B|nr:uncharacterized protein LOC110462319 [Mizuhopecten yessoensis]
MKHIFLIVSLFSGLPYEIHPEKVQLPSFQKLKLYYPGQKHFGGQFTHSDILHSVGVVHHIGFPHDTSAIRLSSVLNKLGPPHSLGRSPIKLSGRFGDSFVGRNGLQYIYHAIAFGPYLADKYGEPDLSVLHQVNAVNMKKKYWGKQGILQIITYSNTGGKPKGHIALWDCYHLHESNDWIEKNRLVTAAFWETPDSDCSSPI